MNLSVEKRIIINSLEVYLYKRLYLAIIIIYGEASYKYKYKVLFNIVLPLNDHMEVVR